jgi:quercetin dioxygenase-like cupin family protein
MSTAHGLIQPPSSPLPLRICLNSDDSDGELGVVELVLDPGTGPPLHVHPTHGEGFYVLTGELTVQVGEQIVTGAPGTWAFAPKDIAHTLANLSDQETRVLCVFAPAGFERRFERMLAEQAGQPLPEPSTAGTRVLGPPLTARAS